MSYDRDYEPDFDLEMCARRSRRVSSDERYSISARCAGANRSLVSSIG